MIRRPRCPHCRNKTGIEADGTVVRKYAPTLDDQGRVIGPLKPLYDSVLHCAFCRQPILERVNGEWVTTHRVK